MLSLFSQLVAWWPNFPHSFITVQSLTALCFLKLWNVQPPSKSKLSTLGSLLASPNYTCTFCQVVAFYYNLNLVVSNKHCILQVLVKLHCLTFLLEGCPQKMVKFFSMEPSWTRNWKRRFAMFYKKTFSLQISPLGKLLR